MTKDVVYPGACSVCTWEKINMHCFEVKCPIDNIRSNRSIVSCKVCFLVNFLFGWSIHRYEGGIKVSHYYRVTVNFPFHTCSVQFSHSVVSDSLWPHESHHTRPLCPSPTPGVQSDSRPLSQWCHPTISSSVVPFSSCPQSLPASESFPMSQRFAWGGQNTGV